MRILIATLYPNYGGSTKVLLASYKALRQEFDVALRAHLPEAGSEPSHLFPTESLDTTIKKMAVLPLVLRAVLSELAYVARHRKDAIYVHDGPSLIVYGIVAKILGMKLVAHVHGPEGQGLRRWLTDKLITFKVHIARFLIDPADKTPRALIANPVEPPNVPSRTRPTLSRLYVAASISDRKNQLLAIEITEEMRRRGHDCTLHLCGPAYECDYLEQIEAVIEACGLHGIVRLEGPRPAAEIFSLADVVLCPSKAEAQTLAVIEALALGIPIVASRIPAHEEIAETVGEPVSRYMLADLNAKAFADALERIEPRAFEEGAATARACYSEERFRRSLIEAFHRI